MEIMRMLLMTTLLVAIGVLVLTLVARAGHGPAVPSARPRATTAQWVGSAARALRLFGISWSAGWDAPAPDLLGVVWEPVEQHDQRDQ
jgi:hypothetical protein